VAAAVAVAAVAVSSPSCPSETCGQVRRAADGQAVLIAGINTGGNGPPFASAVFSQVTVRTIAADSPSGSLVARGKVVFRLPNGVGCNTVQLTSDEKTVLCGKHDGTTAKRSAAYAPKFVALGRVR
jgi:hypothetical protein